MASQFHPDSIKEPATETQELMTFPCDFALKVFGLNDPKFEAIVMSLVECHCPPDTEFTISRNESSKGKYESLTIHFIAQSRAQLDEIYQALTDCEQVVMAL